MTELVLHFHLFPFDIMWPTIGGSKHCAACLIHLQLRKQEKEETQRAAKAALAAAQACHAVAYFTHKRWVFSMGH